MKRKEHFIEETWRRIVVKEEEERKSRYRIRFSQGSLSVCLSVCLLTWKEIPSIGMLVRLTNFEIILVFDGVDAFGLLKLIKICEIAFIDNCYMVNLSQGGGGGRKA